LTRAVESAPASTLPDLVSFVVQERSSADVLSRSVGHIKQSTTNLQNVTIDSRAAFKGALKTYLFSTFFVCNYRSPARSHASIVFTQRSKNWFFAPQGRHIAAINVKFRTGERTAGLLLRAKFHVYRGKNVGPKTVKICNFADRLTPHGRRVCTIFTKFSVFVRVYR